MARRWGNRFVGAVFGASLSVCLSLSAASAGAAPERVRALFDLIGLTAVIASTQDSVAALARSGELPPGGITDWWATASAQHFVPADLIDRYVTGTADLMGSSDVEDLIALFSAPFLLHVSGLETAQQTGFDRTDRARDGAEIVAALSRDNPDRLAAYRDMLSVMGSVDEAVLQTQKISFILIRTLAIGSGAQLDDGAILASLAAQEAEWRVSLEADLMALSAQTYAPLDDAAFARYLDVLKTPLVLGLYDKVSKATDPVITAEYEAFAKTLARLASAEKL